MIMKIKILTDGGFSFGEALIGQVFEATSYGSTAYIILLPSNITGDDPDIEWCYTAREVEEVEE